MANSRSGDSVIARLVRLLATFDRDRTAQTAAEVARRADLPRSTAHRLILDLAEQGLLERDEDGRYRVGLRLWELATRGSLALGLREAALPAMERVQALLQEHTQLAVRENDETLFLERLSAPGAGANVARIAGRLPLHASSAGLVLLAAAPTPVVDRVLARPLQRLAPDTVIDPAAIRRELATIRRAGFAASPGAVESVSTGVAVPVRDAGVVVAALGAVLPRRAANVEPAVRALTAAAAEISAALAAQSSHSTG